MSTAEALSPNILLVEDDSSLASMLADALGTRRYSVWHAGSAAEAEALVEQLQPDLIVVDLMLPDKSGLILCANLKARTGAPVIIGSGRSGQVDRVLSLKLGAEDFITKPFDVEELLARIEAVLRRSTASPSERPATRPADVIRVGQLEITPAGGVATVAGRRLHLTPTEYRLLLVLASHPDEALTREAIGQLVLGYEDLGNGHLLEVHVCRLRQKLRAVAGAPDILTRRGYGYRLVANPAEAHPGT